MNAENLVGNDARARATALDHERVAGHVLEECVRATSGWCPRYLARNLLYLVRGRTTVGRIKVSRVAERDGKLGTARGPRLREDLASLRGGELLLSLLSPSREFY